jgi:hypothetical protein
MPTGYTSIIDDKPETTFRQFVLRCTRAMGACIHMREDPLDAPLPQVIKPDPYHETKWHEAEDNLQKLKRLTAAEIEIEYAEYNQKQAKHDEEYRTKEAAIEQRYREMLAQVEAWTPPSPEHVRFKEFMIEQLNTGGMLNCRYERLKFEPKTPEQWIASEIELANHNIQYHKVHCEKDQANAKMATEWLQQLYASLPGIP